MKKLSISLIILLTTPFIAFAKYNKNNFYIEGNYRFSNSNYLQNDLHIWDQESGYALSTRIGYLVRKNLILGIGYNYDYNNRSRTIAKMIFQNLSLNTITRSYSYDELKNDDVYTPSIFARYILPVSKRVYLSLKGEYSFGWTETSSINKTTEFENMIESTTIEPNKKKYSNTQLVTISPELQFFISKRIGLQLNFDGLSYRHSNTDMNYYADYANSMFEPVYKEEPKKFCFSLKPSNWSIGAFVVIGR